MHFSDMNQLNNWVQKQIERYGKAPSCVPCEITTTVETREISNDVQRSEGRTSNRIGTIVQQESTANQLQNLAEQFAKFVTGQTKTEKLEDLHVLVEEEDVFQNEDGVYEVKDNPQDKL